MRTVTPKLPPTSMDVGLGLRRPLLDELMERTSRSIDFLEFAPENWLTAGGKRRHQLQCIAREYPLICHGLSLSLGGPAPLDETFIKQLKAFFETYNISIYSEHLSYCSDEGQLYDLMPIPFTAEAVTYVARRIARVQDLLERKIAIENVSYYYAPSQEMTELEFMQAVLSEVDCDILLDVNNVYVNSVNHGTDPHQFIQALPTARLRYLHIAGHYRERDDLIIDSHGAAVIDPVWDLLHETYEVHGILPTLLERDDSFPPLEDLLNECEQIRLIQQQYQPTREHADVL